MRASTLKYNVVTLLSGLIATIIILIPFHAILTVWLADNFGHYIAFRLWKEVLLVLITLGAVFLLISDHKVRSHTLTRRLVWLVLLYSLVQIIWGALAYKNHDVSAKALGFGLISNLRLPAFFLVTWAVALRTNRLHQKWQRRVLLPALIVITFGLIQVFLLPPDFLTHFGYGAGTIDPYETINNNEHYVRIISTMRGPNPLGAYLIVPISILAVLIKRGQKRWQEIALLVAALLVLFFSFSRSAWLGALISLSVVTFPMLKSHLLKPKTMSLVALSLVIIASLGFMFRDNARLQNIILHTEEHSTSKISSNDGHQDATTKGMRDIVKHPLGRGTGTSGPASFYNSPTRIPENYFLQIGQETGLIGLTLFLLINAGVGYLLWLKRDDPLALSLFASLIGLSFVNLLSHAWTDDTIAYLWWGLAGIAMVTPKTNEK
jgi:hypothetical protein